MQSKGQTLPEPTMKCSLVFLSPDSDSDPDPGPCPELIPGEGWVQAT